MKDIAEAFAKIVADWSVDNGISSSDAVICLSGTKAWAEARQRHKAGGTDQVVRYLLSAALAEVGRVPYVTLD